MYNRLSRNASISAFTFHLAILVGTTGAITSYVGDEIKAVTKQTDAGEYEIELNDLGDFDYTEVLCVKANIKGSTLENLFPHLQSDTLSSDNKLIVQMVNASATATNVTSGNYLMLEITVRTTKV